MSITARFYRSLYCTLGLACACLGYAELVFLPEMAVFAALVAVLLVIAYRVEGRWSLSIHAANILGAVIALAAIAYVAAQFYRPWGETLLDTLPWPTSLLPYLGPFLMVLVPAKLFRPKHIGDLWSLYGVGLIAVALGCALAGDPLFAILLFAYLISLVWSLTLFYYFRVGQAVVTPALNRTRAAELRVFGKAGLWTLAGTTVAVALFLITPRSGDAHWELALHAGSLQTGISDDQPTIDLNNKGVVSVNRDLAFEVHAFADAASLIPKTDLSPVQRWRSASFNFYEAGRWDYRSDADHMITLLPPDERSARARTGGDAPITPPPARVPSATALPNLGPKQFFLTFRPQGKNKFSPILAEPIWRWPMGTPRNERRVTVATVGRIREYLWYESPDGNLAPPAFGTAATQMTYRQVLCDVDEPDLTAPVAVSDSYRQHLCDCRAVPLLKDWTQALMRRLADGRLLPTVALGPGAAEGEPVRVPPRYSESVARVLRGYLAGSGEFKYTLNLRRQDERLDPAEDFVLNLKVGDCNRFATALALMLRSVGVPARIVLGYRGFDTDGNGVYEVRQNQAHAWVEALIQRAHRGKPPTWHWLTLDPTPEESEPDSGRFSWSQWLDSARNDFSSFFRFFIVEYDADQQGRARSWLARIDWSSTFLGANGDQWWRPALLGALALGLVTVIRRRRRRSTAQQRTRDPAVAVFARLRDAVRKWLGLEQHRGQTPAEFAQAAAAKLAAEKPTAADPDLPAEAVVIYYRMRFGREILSDADTSVLSRRLSRFEADLSAQ